MQPVLRQLLGRVGFIPVRRRAVVTRWRIGRLPAVGRVDVLRVRLTYSSGFLGPLLT